MAVKIFNYTYKTAWIVLGIIGAATVIEDSHILWLYIVNFIKYMASLV